VIALTTTERVAVIGEEGELDRLAERAFADPTFNLNLELAAILGRAADNAQVALSVDKNLLKRTVLPDLTAK
jgi:hypothetical protein